MGEGKSGGGQKRASERERNVGRTPTIVLRDVRTPACDWPDLRHSPSLIGSDKESPAVRKSRVRRRHLYYYTWDTLWARIMVNIPIE